jgi:hypothetical protein
MESDNLSWSSYAILLRQISGYFLLIEDLDPEEARRLVGTSLREQTRDELPHSFSIVSAQLTYLGCQAARIQRLEYRFDRYGVDISL